MAPSTRFERVTYRLGGDCSIQLSYEGVAVNYISSQIPGAALPGIRQLIMERRGHTRPVLRMDR